MVHPISPIGVAPPVTPPAPPPTPPVAPAAVPPAPGAAPTFAGVAAAVPTAPAASPTSAASQASGALGLVGLTGSGKTRQACEAIEYCWETYHKISLVYSSDLGGWGNKMLSLIRLGIARAWYMRNHVDAFATVELATMGGFPAEILGPDTGYADPHVEIVLPRQVKWVPLCPQGHPIDRFADELAMTAALTSPGRTCPTCQTITLLTNVLRIDRVIVRPALFDTVGLRVYDSMTQINDWGMADLQDQSAKGLLPRASKKDSQEGGGSALGSADALRQGGFSWGTSSPQQYGFLQNRTYGWIANVRAIPDQVVPAIMTFGIEMGKGDDESGGAPVMGPKIAGNARTSAVPGWLGNCLHLVLDPLNPPMMMPDGELLMQHRIWTRTHVLSTDPRHIPYLAKHRGDPGAMPAFLADGPEEVPFTTCSLKVFLQLLETQRAEMEVADRKRYADAPGLLSGSLSAETVIGDAPALGTVPGSMPVVALAAGTPAPVAGVAAGVVPVVAPVVPAAAGAVAAPAVPAAPLVPAAPTSLALLAPNAGAVTGSPAPVAPPVQSALTTTQLQRTPRPPTI